MSLTKVTNRVIEADVLIPPGAVMSFARDTAPSGWLICDGASLSRTVSNNAYQPLHTAIGYVFGGSGDIFNLPDLRGEFVRGWSDGKDVGGQSTRLFGSTEEDAIRNITGVTSVRRGRLPVGNTSITTDTLFEGGPFEFDGLGPTRIERITVGDTIGFPRNYKFNASLVVPTAEDNRPRNIALLYCIKWN